MTTVYIITDLVSGQKWYRLSVTSILKDIEIPINISDRQFRNVQSDGFPFEHSGCSVDKVEALGLKDIKAENPPIIKKGSIDQTKWIEG